MKSDKSRTCRRCARISRRDLDRGYCPFTASCIHPDRPAASCMFFLDKDDPAARLGDDEDGRR